MNNIISTAIDNSPITSFEGKYEFLSNFYPCMIRDRIYGLDFPSAEHFYQSRKTMDVNLKIQISKMTAGQAKRFAHKSISLPQNWKAGRIFTMSLVIYCKFMSDEMKTKLFSTENRVLVEGNRWHDTFWGKCYCETCNGTGDNMLGNILMFTRARLRNAEPVFKPIDYEWIRE